jgi:hypothetical protein
MKDRSSILVLGALVVLFVALSTLDVSFMPLGSIGRQLLPVLVIGVIVLFLMRVKCCDRSCDTHEGEDT